MTDAVYKPPIQIGWRWILAIVLGGIPILEWVIVTQSWGVLGLIGYFLILLTLMPPDRMIHPNTFVFGYYFLWLVCPAIVDFYFASVNWVFVLPTGRIWDWSSLSAYTLVQIQMTMTTLVVIIHFVTRSHRLPALERDAETARSAFGKVRSPILLNITIFVLIAVFIQASGGLTAWVTNYSETFLTGRAGLGVLNVAIITLSTLAVIIAGMRNYANRGGFLGVLWALPLILAVGYFGGFKSRLIILLLCFFLPYLLTTKVTLVRLAGGSAAFFVVLYLLTAIRAQGYYTGTERFLEMIPTYFNSFPLHDLVVTSRNSGLFETAYQFFVKPAQILGLASKDLDFDISVMLTKEYFPDQWYTYSATQQWPLETDMYLNFHGVALQTIPLSIYAVYIAKLYKIVVHKGKWLFLPVLALELFRIISTMRGTLLPWSAPMLAVQYAFLIALSAYFMRPALRRLKRRKG